jgi:MFS transporter, DHA1 family, multidrug resistance protein
VWLLRATQAFGGGFASVTAMVFVRDWFEGKQVAKLATLIGMIMMLAPLFAPVIGSFLLDWGGWHSIFFFLAGYAVVLFFIFLAVMPESRHHKHLTHRVTKEQLIGKYRIFFSHRQPVLMLMTISFATAGMFTFITSSSFIYIEYYGFTHRVFPLLFGANVVLYIALSILNNWLLKTREPEQMMKLGLILQLTGGVFMAAGVSLPHPPFALIFGAIVLFVGSLGLIFGNGTAVILNLMPEISGSANATIGVSRFILSFIAGTIPALFQSGNLKPIGIVMFSLSLLANLFYLLFKRS